MSNSILIKKDYGYRLHRDTTKIRVTCKICSKYTKQRLPIFNSISKYALHLFRNHKDDIDKELVNSEIANLHQNRQGLIAN